MAHPLLAPRLLALHLLGIVATGAAVWLGIWQYHVWQAARTDEAAARVDAPVVPLTGVLGPDAAMTNDVVSQPVQWRGRWLPESTFYVADRQRPDDEGARAGVWAVTPVAVCGGDARCQDGSAMLVVRGWASSRETAPAPPRGDVRLTGWLQPGEGSGASDPNPTDDVLPELRLADAVQRVDRDLYSGYVIARAFSPGSTAGSTAGVSSVEPGLEPVTPASLPDASALTSVRNLLYAFEWWAFAAFAAYVWVRWCRDEVSRAGGVPSPA